MPSVEKRLAALEKRADEIADKIEGIDACVTAINRRLFDVMWFVGETDKRLGVRFIRAIQSALATAKRKNDHSDAIRLLRLHLNALSAVIPSDQKPRRHP